MEKLFSELGINWKILITQLVNFGILVALLRWLLYRPLLNLLEKRQKKLALDMKNSEEIGRKLAEATTKEAETLTEARKKGQKLIAEAEQSAKSLKESLVSDAHKEAEKVISAGKRSIEEDRVKLAAELRKEIGGVITLAIEKSLGDVLDAKTQQTLEAGAIAKIKG